MTAQPQARRSVGIMVAASLVSAVCGVIQTFWIPRVLSIDDFGYWRTFLLYMGYAGLLHIGLVDGALLLWSQDPRQKQPGPYLLRRSLRFVAAEHLVLAALAALLLLLHPSHVAAPVVAALAAYAFLFNLVGVAQVYLQAHLRFTPVAVGMCAPGVVFVIFLGILALTHATVSRLLAAYLLAWGITLLLLLTLSLRGGTKESNANAAPYPGAGPKALSGTWRLGLSYIAAGWPIVLANTGFGLMQSADRVTINITRPIHDFAIYSLSQSTIYVPITILAAVSRVAFSYFARVTHEGRSGVYTGSTRVLTLLWAFLLPYFFAVEMVVRRFLPKYIPGLPAGRILLLSVLFLSLIQVIQLNTYSLEGRQRQFFAGSLVAVLVAFATAWIGSRIVGTLTAVAWSQVITALLWWLANEWAMRKRSLLRISEIGIVLATFTLAAAGLLLAASWKGALIPKLVLYYGFIAISIIFWYRPELHGGLTTIRKSLPGAKIYL